MKTKRKSHILRYLVVGLILVGVSACFLLPKEDRVYLIYAILFALITPLFDGMIIPNWLEKKAEKRAKNPLIDQ